MTPGDKEREIPASHILAGQQTGHILLIPLMLYQHEVPWNLPIPADAKPGPQGAELCAHMACGPGTLGASGGA